MSLGKDCISTHVLFGQPYSSFEYFLNKEKNEIKFHTHWFDKKKKMKSTVGKEEEKM